MNTKPDKSNKSGGLLRTTGTVGGWTMVSRLLGFVRDILLARVLGAGLLADAFFVAFRMPNFFRRLFAEGTLTVALVPVLAEERKKGEDTAHAFLNALAGLLLVTVVLVAVAGIIFMPALLYVFAPGFHDEPGRWAQALTLARWMFPYMAVISLAAMAWGVLNTYRRFAVPAASPALMNIAIIFAAIILAPGFSNPALALAIGVLLGGVLQLGIQFPALKRIGWVPRPTFRQRSPAVKKTLRLLGPAVLAVAAVQINILVGTILATLLPVGAVSYLYYADRIVQLPLALFGIAMGTALLPTLSEHFARNRHEQAERELSRGLAWLTWITLPATVGIILLAKPIIITLFEHGRFTHQASLATAHTLQAYGIGLIAFSWAKVLATACYARQDAKAPARFAAISVAANIALALVLMWRLEYLGLALATSLAAFVNVGLLIHHLQKRQTTVIDSESIRRMLRAICACVPLAGFLLGLGSIWMFPASDEALRAAWLLLAVAGGVGIYFVAARLLGEKLLAFRARSEG